MTTQSASIYYDSALIAKFYLNEPGRDLVRNVARSVAQVNSSAISIVEVSAAFHRKFREGGIDAIQLHALQQQFSHDVHSGLWRILPLTETVIESARDLFGKLNETVYLRSLDAIHLVTARIEEFDHVFSNDRRLLAACEQLKLTGVNPLD